MPPLPSNRPPRIVFIPSTDPLGDPAGAAGYAASVRMPGKLQGRERKQRTLGVKTVLNDPLLTQKLADRVYELLLEDLRQSKERRIDFGGRF